MGCGGSKEAPLLPGPHKGSTPVAAAAAAEPECKPQAVVKEQPVHIPEPPQAIVHDDKPSNDALTKLMQQGINMHWLLEMAQNTDYNQLTIPQFQQQVLADKNNLTRLMCKAVNDDGAANSGQPLYWAFVEPCSRQPFSKIITMIQQHIQQMEPDKKIEGMAIWFDFICLNDSFNVIQPAKEAAADWLVESSIAKPTLVCWQKLPSITNECSRQLGCVDSKDSPTIMAKSHEPFLALWRSKQGLHGYQKAFFDTVHAAYVD